MRCSLRSGAGPALATLLAATGLSSGCTHAPATGTSTAGAERAGLHASVDGSLIVAEASARMSLASNQVVIPGVLTNPEVAPAYPQALLALGLPDQAVCVGFVVGTDGSVSAVAPVYGSDKGCPATAADSRPEFTAATVDAVSRWDYFSYLRCTFPPGTPDVDKCNGAGASAEPVAVSLAYRFLFSVRDGVGSVQQAQ